ncbi:MAG TPA: hypothetical protein VGT04_14095 [Acidobacteriaceae bacterium]|nr:hypothetical protein [Acidobacteriaceae bacterium]
MVSPRVFRSRFVSLSLVALFLCISAAAAFGDPGTFDLDGPKLEVMVTRAGKTLPITEVPNLAVGDRLWIHPDFPPDQAARYMLVAAFLRGATNIPPQKWFYRADTWDKKFNEKGLTITVPDGAQQVLLFLAPEANGDFKTLMGAVRGQPGAFVRASQDLNQAMLDRTRLDKYLSAVHRVNSTNPEKLAAISPLLARSLDVKIDPVCLSKDVDEIAPCLTEKADTMILNDGHSTSIVQALTGGPASDLVMQASYTPQASYGYYSPYISSAMDIARIFNSFRTAEYQYIPALAEQSGGDALSLKLNTPPSFHNPKSVLVIALPAVEPAQPPPLHPVDENQVYCAQNTTLALPVDGAPLVFSTNYARNLTLHLQAANGKSVDLPLTPDAVRGGLDVDTKPLAGTVIGADVKASIRGSWGFEPFAGPVVRLQGAHEQTWTIAAADEDALVVGRDDTLHLEADDASCVDGVQFRGADGKEIKAKWKLVKPNQVEVTVPLKNAQPGAMTLLVTQAGLAKPQGVAVHAFAEAGHLETFTLHAGDHQGMLTGTRLNEVASLSMDGIVFKPSLPTSVTSKTIPLDASNKKAASALKSGETFTATAMLRDGRKEEVAAVVDDARPSVILITKYVQDDSNKADSEAQSNIQLSDPNELPQNALLLFSLKTQTPDHFSRSEKIEIETEDGSYSTMLTLASGLTLQDRHTALATLDPAKAFGSSAFGPLQFRVVTDDGVTGDWQPLAMLVRLPGFQSLQCSDSPNQPCTLTGSDLFLVDSIANDQKFTTPVQVPDGFPGRVLPVPHPAEGGQLYVKLRDDPSVINLVTLTPEITGVKKAAAKKAYRPEYVSPADSASSSQKAAATATPKASPAVAPKEPPPQADAQGATTDPSPKAPVQAAPTEPDQAGTAKTVSAANSPNWM